MEGRIDQWQPRRRQQRRKRNTKTVSVKKRGTRKRPPKFFGPNRCTLTASLPFSSPSPQCCAVAFYTSQAPAVTCSECRLLTRCTKGLIPEKPCLARDF